MAWHPALYGLRHGAGHSAECLALPPLLLVHGLVARALAVGASVEERNRVEDDEGERAEGGQTGADDAHVDFDGGPDGDVLFDPGLVGGVVVVGDERL